MRGRLVYRISQFLSLFLGARISLLIFIAFSLYTSAFSLFNQERNVLDFLKDYKIHGIVLCSLLSIASGGIINQFYDKQKDRIIKPYLYKIQSFVRQKHFLFLYIIFNFISLGIAFFLSQNILVFFLIYQFFIWFYSHKLSKILIVNNLSHGFISLYPFLGLQVYYHDQFSLQLFWMASFLFILMLIIDILKDMLTYSADKMFGYVTLPVFFGDKTTSIIIATLLFINTIMAIVVLNSFAETIPLSYYFFSSPFVFLSIVYFMLGMKRKKRTEIFVFLKIWVVFGVFVILIHGVLRK